MADGLLTCLLGGFRTGDSNVGWSFYSECCSGSFNAEVLGNMVVVLWIY